MLPEHDVTNNYRAGELIKIKAGQYFVQLYPDEPVIKYLNGLLDCFNQPHKTKSHKRFGESGSAGVQAIEKEFSIVRLALNEYDLKDICNTYKTGLFWRMEADGSLATKQLEGHKQNGRPPLQSAPTPMVPAISHCGRLKCLSTRVSLNT